MASPSFADASQAQSDGAVVQGEAGSTNCSEGMAIITTPEDLMDWERIQQIVEAQAGYWRAVGKRD